MIIYSFKESKSLLELETKDWEIVNEGFKRLEEILPKLQNTKNKIDPNVQWKIKEEKKVKMIVSIEKEIKIPSDEDDEKYSLLVDTEKSEIKISSPTSTGILRAFSTIKQLILKSKNDSDCFFVNYP